MNYMLCRNRVQDFSRWYDVFRSHRDAQREAGLTLLHLLRDLSDPNNVVMFFSVADIDKARAFTGAPEARQAADLSGVLGTPELLLLSDQGVPEIAG
jgi:hypothetical protein